jgi:hypothetical protein
MPLCASPLHEIDNSSRRSLTQHRGQLGNVGGYPARLFSRQQLGGGSPLSVILEINIGKRLPNMAAPAQ